MTRKFVIWMIEGGQILDVTGPAAVFAEANSLAPGYCDLTYASSRGGDVQQSCGMVIGATKPLAAISQNVDLLVVTGGSEQSLIAAAQDRDALEVIQMLAKRSTRVAGICTGAFVLAEAGLLDGRKCVTHWASCDLLQDFYPSVRVEQDALFVQDGNVFTSAGVTAGIDLALKLVELDLGRSIAAQIARNLVLFLRRSGGQSQFSAPLRGQDHATTRFADLVAWISENLAADLGVVALAAHMGMSERNFARGFAHEIGSTPAKYVASARYESARRMLEESDWPLTVIAQHCGFGSVDSLHRAFRLRSDLSPMLHRQHFA